MLDFGDGTVVDVNAAGLRFFGSESNALKDTPIADVLLSEGDDCQWPTLLRTLRLEGGFMRQGVHVRVHGGVLRRADVSAMVLREGNRREVLVWLRPGTIRPDRRDHEKDLSRHAAVGLYRVDADGRLTHANKRLADLLGYESPEQLLQSDTASHRHWHVDARPAGPESRTSGGGIQRKLQIKRVEGDTRWVLETIRDVSDHKGNPRGQVGTLLEIDDEVAAENALAVSEDKYRSLVEHSQDGVFVIRDDVYVFVNQVYAAMLGFSPDEMIGESFLRFFAPEDRQKIVDMWHERQAGHWDMKAYEAHLLKKDGKTRVLVSVRSGPIHYAGEMASTGTVRDITAYRHTQQKLSMAEQRFRDIFEHAVIGIYQSTGDGRLLAANPALAHILGYDSVEALQREVINVRSVYKDPKDRDQLLAKAEAEGRVQGAESRLRHRDGTELWVQDSTRAVRDSSGEILFYEGMVANITARKLVEEALHRSEQLFRTLVENTQVGIFMVRGGALSYVNRAAANMLGYEETALTGKPLTGLFGPEERDWLKRIEREPVDARTGQVVEKSLVSADGGRIRVNLSVATAVLDDSPVTIMSVQDLTREKRAEARLRRLATHDPLTDLPNRTVLNQRLIEVIAETRRTRKADWAVLFLDLDAFKLVNDSLGHAAGDQLLGQVAGRLLQAIDAGDLVCHHGGDEFVILALNIAHEIDAVELAERLEAAMAEPFMLDEREIYNQVTIGIALGRCEYANPEEVLRDADSAMVAGKRLGKVCHVVFSSSMHIAAMQRLELETRLRAGLARNEFDCHYQPIVDIRDNRVQSFEALLRWHHPEHGLTAPGAFLRVAEESGVIVPMGWAGLRRALQACKCWHGEADARPVSVAVNLSDAQFRLPQLPERIARELESAQLAPERLHLEVTERVFLETPALARRTLNRLHDLGVKLYLDDFGTGYSALSYLRQLPFDALKIDRSFVETLPRDARTAAIVRSIISLANDLELAVVAEGIERAEQIDVLVEMGCRLFQGYLFGRPMDREQTLAYLNGSAKAGRSQAVH